VTHAEAIVPGDDDAQAAEHEHRGTGGPACRLHTRGGQRADRRSDAAGAGVTRMVVRDPGNRDATDITIEPKVIVLHYTAGGTAEGTFQYFSGNHMEAARSQLAAAGDVNVSSHFLVDRDGTIYRLMPETRMARHCIGLNHIAIGVENVGDDKKWPLTDAQVEADARLVRYLAATFPITHLIGHSEAVKLDGKIYFRERDPKYRNSKPDPGAQFMKRVRARVADLKLQGPP
jgi:N-acetylmuramoyl-L-alanine amidase